MSTPRHCPTCGRQETEHLHPELRRELERQLGYDQPTGRTAEDLLREATERWRTAAALEADLRPQRDHLIALAATHGLPVRDIADAVGLVHPDNPDSPRVLTWSRVQQLTPNPKDPTA